MIFPTSAVEGKTQGPQADGEEEEDSKETSHSCRESQRRSAWMEHDVPGERGHEVPWPGQGMERHVRLRTVSGPDGPPMRLLT